MHALDQWCTDSAHRCPVTYAQNVFNRRQWGELGIGTGTFGLGLRGQYKVMGQMCETVKGNGLHYSSNISEYTTNHFYSVILLGIIYFQQSNLISIFTKLVTFVVR